MSVKIRMYTTLLLLNGVLQGLTDDDCSQRPFTLVTFNAALTPLVSLYEERKAEIPAALKEIDADVLCLQEVTYEEDMRDILQQLKKVYPYSWSFLHSTFFTDYELYKSPNIEQKLAPCDTENYTTLSHCIQNECGGLTGYILALCSINSCINEFFNVPTDCISCLAGSLDTLELSRVKCVSGSGGRRRYQSEDILILSKHPIETVKRVKFNPGIRQVYPRGLLEANIHRLGKVICTHLTADLPALGLPYIEVKLNEIRGLTSYVEQQRDEINQIKTLYGSQSMILVGDLNTGPPNPEQRVDGEIISHYESLLSEGFDSPYVEWVGKCTYCEDNFVAWPANTILDHVLLRGYKTISVSRIFDNATEPLSDHYGIKVTLCKK